MKKSHLTGLRACLALLLTGMVTSASAFVVTPLTPPDPLTSRTFEFVGSCTVDCTPSGSLATAKVTVGLDYTPGDALSDPLDILWFEFDSPHSDVIMGPLVAEHVGSVSGSLPAVTGPSLFSINFNTDVNADSDLFRFTFESFANGDWTIQSFASQMPNDAGTDGVWHVPEPATTALLMFGLAGLGYQRRSQGVITA